MKRPFICFCFTFAAVLLIFGAVFDCGTVNLLLTSALCIFCTFGAVVAVYKSDRRRLAAAVITCAVAAGCCCRFAFDRIIYSPAAELCGKTHHLELITVENPQNYEKYSRMKVKILSADSRNFKIGRTAVLYTDNLALKIGIGDSISGIFLCEKPENSLDFNSYTYNKAKGIYVYLTDLGQTEIVKCTRTPLSLLPIKFAQKISSVYSKFMPPRYAAFCSALLTGDKSGIDYITRDRLSVCGVSHVLSVSGMHLSLLTGIILLIFGKRVGSIIALPAILIFMPFAGFSPSVVRAGIMNIILIFSFLLRRGRDSLSALSAAVFGILLFNPYAVCDVGFVLSCGASAGILLFYPIFTRLIMPHVPRRILHIPVLGKAIKGAVGALCSTMSANVLTLPACALFFGRISVIAPLANILILPLISILFALCILLGIFGLFSTFAAACIVLPTEFIVCVITFIVNLLGKLPFAAFPIKNFYFFTVTIAVYLILFLRAHGKINFESAAFLLPAVCAVGIIFSGISFKNAFNVTIFNCGGPAVLIRSYSAAVLVDCGCEYNGLSARKIYNNLSMNGVNRADALVLTQIDDEHAGGAPELLRSGSIRTIFMPCGGYRDPDLAVEIYRAAEQCGVPIYPQADHLCMGELDISTVELTSGGNIAQIMIDDFSLLSAHSDNIFAVNKALGSADDKKFDVIIADYSALSHKNELNRLCSRTGAEFIAIPDKIFSKELPTSGTDCFFLSECGDITINIK